jgi:hypothetical protein
MKMSKDDRNVLELLKAELDLIESGDYTPFATRVWHPHSIFEDSPTCLNYGYPYQAHPCPECLLYDLVPEEARTLPAPCHHIPLDESGITIEKLEKEGDNEKLLRLVEKWLKAKIKEIEEGRAQYAASNSSTG